MAGRMKKPFSKTPLEAVYAQLKGFSSSFENAVANMDDASQSLLRWSYTESNPELAQAFSCWADLDYAFGQLIQQFCKKSGTYRQVFKDIRNQENSLKKMETKTADEVTRLQHKVDQLRSSRKVDQTELLDAVQKIEKAAEKLKEKTDIFEKFKAKTLRDALTRYSGDCIEILANMLMIFQTKKEIGEMMSETPADAGHKRTNGQDIVKHAFKKVHLELPIRGAALGRHQFNRSVSESIGHPSPPPASPQTKIQYSKSMPNDQLTVQKVEGTFDEDEEGYMMPKSESLDTLDTEDESGDEYSEIPEVINPDETKMLRIDTPANLVGRPAVDVTCSDSKGVDFKEARKLVLGAIQPGVNMDKSDQAISRNRGAKPAVLPRHKDSARPHGQRSPRGVNQNTTEDISHRKGRPPKVKPKPVAREVSNNKTAESLDRASRTEHVSVKTKNTDIKEDNIDDSIYVFHKLPDQDKDGSDNEDSDNEYHYPDVPIGQFVTTAITDPKTRLPPGISSPDRGLHNKNIADEQDDGWYASCNVRDSLPTDQDDPEITNTYFNPETDGNLKPNQKPKKMPRASKLKSWLITSEKH